MPKTKIDLPDKDAPGGVMAEACEKARSALMPLVNNILREQDGKVTLSASANALTIDYTDPKAKEPKPDPEPTPDEDE